MRFCEFAIQERVLLFYFLRFVVSMRMQRCNYSFAIRNPLAKVAKLSTHIKQVKSMVFEGQGEGGGATKQGNMVHTFC